ncbi:MAG: zeta toxin family protein [Bacteroidetes bacterium]|nr:zeta toxin family protein [Bacteroidota bacterium]MBI3482223.1 zeta toxin family protein [Bacteroidota bacterium]
MPNLYVIAGCNGAGKTTASYTVLPEILNCKEFVNADEIARGLSPFQPETVSFQAGRIMLQRVKELLKSKVDFGFETTLATRSYVQLINQAKKYGFTVVLIYFWLESVDLAKARVKSRVEKGGHNIPPDVIERRYKRGVDNFFSTYKNLADKWIFYNNSFEAPVTIAGGNSSLANYVYNDELWKTIQANQ